MSSSGSVPCYVQRRVTQSTARISPIYGTRTSSGMRAGVATALPAALLCHPVDGALRMDAMPSDVSPASFSLALDELQRLQDTPLAAPRTYLPVNHRRNQRVAHSEGGINEEHCCPCLRQRQQQQEEHISHNGTWPLPSPAASEGGAVMAPALQPTLPTNGKVKPEAAAATTAAAAATALSASSGYLATRYGPGHQPRHHHPTGSTVRQPSLSPPAPSPLPASPSPSSQSPLPQQISPSSSIFTYANNHEQAWKGCDVASLFPSSSSSTSSSPFVNLTNLRRLPSAQLGTLLQACAAAGVSLRLSALQSYLDEVSRRAAATAVAASAPVSHLATGTTTATAAAAGGAGGAVVVRRGGEGNAVTVDLLTANDLVAALEGLARYNFQDLFRQPSQLQPQNQHRHQRQQQQHNFNPESAWAAPILNSFLITAIAASSADAPPASRRLVGPAVAAGSSSNGEGGGGSMNTTATPGSAQVAAAVTNSSSSRGRKANDDGDNDDINHCAEVRMDGKVPSSGSSSCTDSTDRPPLGATLDVDRVVQLPGLLVQLGVRPPLSWLQDFLVHCTTPVVRQMSGSQVLQLLPAVAELLLAAKQQQQQPLGKPLSWKHVPDVGVWWDALMDAWPPSSSSGFPGGVADELVGNEVANKAAAAGAVQPSTDSVTKLEVQCAVLYYAAQCDVSATQLKSEGSGEGSSGSYETFRAGQRRQQMNPAKPTMPLTTRLWYWAEAVLYDIAAALALFPTPSQPMQLIQQCRSSRSGNSSGSGEVSEAPSPPFQSSPPPPATAVAMALAALPDVMPSGVAVAWVSDPKGSGPLVLPVLLDAVEAAAAAGAGGGGGGLQQLPPGLLVELLAGLTRAGLHPGTCFLRRHALVLKRRSSELSPRLLLRAGQLYSRLGLAPSVGLRSVLRGAREALRREAVRQDRALRRQQRRSGSSSISDGSSSNLWQQHRKPRQQQRQWQQ
ncbi:hypothetical protein Agub_g3771 [Astrephomene gubernaculifera]|uniref:Uncharacterized protein n=1 Tax=Astrephomene gubernaculifera TaxID=47775 RepID=A0AAD3DJ76_9CHLO|nr:hypothetical protein Agub_g3771 [Astrephomene gubernaculifera]